MTATASNWDKVLAEGGPDDPRLQSAQEYDQSMQGTELGPTFGDNNQHGQYSFESMWAEPVHFKDGEAKFAPGYSEGANGSLVKWQGGGPGPAQGSSGTLMAPAGGAGSMAGSYGYGGGGYGTLGSPSGGAGGYALPDSAGASQSLRDLQLGATGGLASLMKRDTTAERKKVQDALYAGQAEGINSAAERARMAMLEGTFGRGVGPSSITVELAGRGQQEHSDALARALREAFTQAGSEDRADLSSQQGLYSAGGALATAGLQGEANVNLANLAREQQESQFSRNLGFQGGENAANREQRAGEFGQNLGLQYSQLGQQNAQFQQNLGFQGSENAANRSAASSENAAGREFAGGQAELNRQLQQMILDSQQGFAGTQAGLNRDAAAAGQAAQFGFQGTENQAQRDLAQLLQESSQSFAGGQNQAQRDAQMQSLLLQLANSQDIAGGNAVAGGIGALGSGLGAVLGPFLAQLAKNGGG